MAQFHRNQIFQKQKVRRFAKQSHAGQGRIFVDTPLGLIMRPESYPLFDLSWLNRKNCKIIMLDPKDNGGLSMVQEERLVRLNAVSILGVQKKN